jgi:hypothetical protein
MSLEIALNSKGVILKVKLKGAWVPCCDCGLLLFALDRPLYLHPSDYIEVSGHDVGRLIRAEPPGQPRHTFVEHAIGDTWEVIGFNWNRQINKFPPTPGPPTPDFAETVFVMFIRAGAMLIWTMLAMWAMLVLAVAISVAWNCVTSRSDWGILEPFLSYH